MLPKQLPPRELVQQLLDYDPLTGIFVWRPRDNKNWNAKYAGKIAGSDSHSKYNAIFIHNRQYLAHRLAWLLYYGEPIPDEIDHKDGNPHNNKIDNLRSATRAENIANSKLSNRNTTGYKGVKFGINGRYSAVYRYEGQNYSRTFRTLEEAANFRKTMAERRFGAFARHK